MQSVSQFSVEEMYKVPKSRTKGLFRSLGLSLFYEAWISLRHKSRPVYEARKIAIRGDRYAAALAGMIHFIPISTAIAMSALNVAGLYIGGELSGKAGQDTEKLAGLQFAAKLHELTINASIAAMILSYLRHELAVGDGLPFGAIFAGLKFQDISTLWSQEFWGMIRARFIESRRKWVMICLIIVSALLGVSVGPSSANIIKPRMDEWPAGGTDFWIDMPPGMLWANQYLGSDVSPSCDADLEDPSCPYGNWRSLADGYLSFWPKLTLFGYMPQEVQIPGAKSVRELRIETRSEMAQFALPWTMATISYSVDADALAECGRLWAWAVYRIRKKWRFWSRKNAIYSLEARQPVVQTRCLMLNASTYYNTTKTFWNLTENQMPYFDLSSLSPSEQLGDFPVIGFENQSLSDAIKQLSNTTASPQLIWHMIPQPSSGNTTLGALAAIPQWQNAIMTFYQCTVDARIAPTSLTSMRNPVKIVTGEPDDWIFHGTYGDNNLWPHISIDPAWAAFLNPNQPLGNLTTFQSMTRSAGLWNSTAWLQDPGDTDVVVESILALMLANGLGRRGFDTGFVGDLKGTLPGSGTALTNECGEWCKEIMPCCGRNIGFGGSAFNVSSTVASNATKYTMRAKVNGYAYSAKGLTAKYSIAVLLTYSVLVTGHWIYLVWTGETSSSWDTSGEITTLAMNSRRTQKLVNTGAGIESTKVFRERVRVVAIGDHLELAFEESEDQEKLELNGFYS